MTTGSSGQIAAQVGDTPAEIENPFHLHFSGEFRTWLAQQRLSLALTTYEGAKLIIIGPGLDGRTTVTERNFERCMALYTEDEKNIWLSSDHQIWRLENGLQPNQQYDGWDRIYLPRTAHVTGGVDVHDLALNKEGHLLGVITLYNCIARMDDEYGCFSPLWRPSFISEIIAEDRCHLNGFCLNDGDLAYATAVGQSNEKEGWRAHRDNGGIIIDIKTNEMIAQDLSMPHTPRLYNKKLYFLEAGKGWFCCMDIATKKIEKLLWRPGFLRGLRFHGQFAFICSSKPRDETFKGLLWMTSLKKEKKPRVVR